MIRVQGEHQAATSHTAAHNIECNNTPATPGAEWQANTRGRRGLFGRCCSWDLAE